VLPWSPGFIVFIILLFATIPDTGVTPPEIAFPNEIISGFSSS
jgi:hypothetical protein